MHTLDRLAMIGCAVLLAACGDDASSANRGRASDGGGMDGAVAPSDAGPSSSTDGSPANDGTGGVGGVRDTGGDGVGGDPQPTCSDRPQSVPDAGGDACLACVIEHCCEDVSAVACFAGNGAGLCYRTLFARYQKCFVDAIASGSTEESWYIAAACVREHVAPEDYHDAGSGRFPIQVPWNWSPGTELTRCVVGTLPEEDPEEDGGVGPIRMAFQAAGYWVGDQVDDYPHPNCAEHCFPGWR